MGSEERAGRMMGGGVWGSSCHLPPPVALLKGWVLLVGGHAGQVGGGEPQAVHPQDRTAILEEEWVELRAVRSGKER